MIKVHCENEHGKGYINALKCPNCGDEIIGCGEVIDFINEELITETQYDDYECQKCECLFSFNIEKMELGEKEEDYEGREIYSLETWIWNEFEAKELKINE